MQAKQDIGRGISIIIPCYNDGRYITETISSVYAQNLKIPFEIIIVDDGSNDSHTLPELDRMECNPTLPNLEIIHHKENKGLPATRNTGLEAARYSYVFFLDADDLLSTDPHIIAGDSYPERGVKFLEENPDHVFVCPNIRLFEGVESSFCFKKDYQEKDILIDNPIGPFIICRREEALAVNGYNPALTNSQDWDFAVTLVNERIKNASPAKVHRFPEIFIDYRVRKDGTNITQNRKLSRHDVIAEITRRNPEIYNKHFPGLKGEALINRVDAEREALNKELYRDFAVYCIKHPFNAYAQGVIDFTLWQIEKKLKNLWGHNASTPEKESAPALVHEKL